MLQRQKGQAFILVLILLAVGGLLITPALNLASTGLKSRMAQHTSLMEYYATDGAQEYSLWLLRDPQFVADLINSEEGEVGPFYIVLNRVPAEYSITWQAAEDAPPSDAPLTEDRYRITVAVTPDDLDPPPSTEVQFIYTITLQYMYPDVETEPLEELEVHLPPHETTPGFTGFTYVDGSTSGFTTADPDISSLLKKGYILEWNFDPAISFNYWEKKTISFRATAIPAEDAYYTEAEVYTAAVPQPRGLTGPTAPIIVGDPLETGIPRLNLRKTVDPEVIPPGLPVLLTYTIHLENQSSVEDVDVLYVEDALPAGFSYAGGDTGFLLLCDGGEPSGSIIPQTTRELWQWKFAIITFTVPAGETLTGSFQAIGTVDSSGTYANELWIKAPGADIGQEYSWPTGGVIVPQFDIESTSGGTTLKVVTEVSGGSHNIKSWQVE